DEPGLPRCDPRPYAGQCELAQPGGGLFRAAAKEGPDAQRLSGLARVGIADQAVRGTDQPGAQAVRLEVHQVRPVRPAAAPGQEGGRSQGVVRYPDKPGLTWSPQIQPYSYLPNGPLRCFGPTTPTRARIRHRPPKLAHASSQGRE